MPQILSFTAPRLEIKDFEKEVCNLSHEEKKSAYDDLYGKIDATIETSEMLESRLEEMQRELDVIPIDKKQSFLNAMERCPNHANDASFRLQFIRADRYNPAKAATRFVKYWKAKEFCFGSDKAFHPLTLDDLNDDDLATLRNNGYMIFSKRDKAGRSIIFNCRQKYIFKERKNILRLMFYMVNSALEDPSTQRNGFVTLLFEDGAYDVAKGDRKLDRLLVEYTSNIWPIKILGMHMCFDSKLQELVLPIGLYLMGDEMRARFRLHPGSRKSQRCEDFSSYGITPDCLPRVMGGEMLFEPEKLLEHRRYVEKAREEEIMN